MGVGAVIGSFVGGIVQAKGASKAAKAQEAAANRDIDFQKETRDLIRRDLDPYRSGGLNAFNAYQYEMGLGEAPTFGGTAPAIETYTIPGSAREARPGMVYGGGSPASNITSARGGGGARPTTGYRVNGQNFATLQEAQAYANANRTGGQTYGGFQKSQDYLFGLNEGTNAVQASAAARGGLFSGAAMKDLNTFAQDYGSQRRDQFLNRLGGLADTGLSAAQMSGNASTNAAAGVSNALSNIGNAQAAGAVGVGNAWNNALGNAVGAWQYQKGLQMGAR